MKYKLIKPTNRRKKPAKTVTFDQACWGTESN